MWLASVVSEIDGARDAQGAAATLPAGLFPHTIGSVDTVPLYVQKPVVSRLNTALYSGSKYKHTVLKFQRGAWGKGSEAHGLPLCRFRDGD